jgi:hypothetical protein
VQSLDNIQPLDNKQDVPSQIEKQTFTQSRQTQQNPHSITADDQKAAGNNDLVNLIF